MPPPSTKAKLTDAQKATLKRWVEQGADYAPHWAFVAPKQAPLPEVKQKDWARNPVDAFVLARLEKEGLKPSPEADRYALVRRAYLDLIGLPPTPEDADAFVQDKSPDAYEKVVDRLLASPQYGERWARRWLDLARYADTNGYEKDRPRSIWPYRDWVIKAINADMPFDRFTVEQLAGDLLPNATVDQKVATGFHRNTMRNEEGGIDPLEFRYYSMVDRVGTTGTTWLGLTVACAQCHTHKYDPIRHSEYYGLMAFLDNADEPELDLPDDAWHAKRKEAEAQVAKMTAALPQKWPVKGDVLWRAVSQGAGVAVKSAAGSNVDGGAVDGSWKFGGNPPPESDTYTFTVTADAATTIDRVKVDALVDGETGPGRTAHGNFVLTEVSVAVTPAGPGGKPTPVKLARADAAYSQNGFPAADAIDGKPKTGWAVDAGPDTRKDRSATFYFDKPVALKPGAKVRVTLAQEYGQQHVIGKLKLSLGGVKQAPAASADTDRAAAVDAAFKAWVAKQTPRAVRWQPLRPSDMKSNAPTLTLLDDGSVLASGDITKSDTFDLTFKAAPKNITGVRVEALPHESLPKNGPGMVYYEGPIGDFCLSELTLKAGATDGKFVRTAHDYAAGNFESAKAIDGNPQTGWMINGQQGKPHVAVFALKDAVSADGELKIGMLFERHFAPALGHFRVSVTTDPMPPELSAFPPDVEAALRAPEAERTKPQAEALFAYFLQQAPELAEARKEIDALFRKLPEPPTTLVMVERPAGHERTTRLHHRGEFTDPKEPVAPGVPAFLPPLPAGAKADRLAFARWLVSPENPLTARVTVNRQWQAFFGRGIVRTTEDFGFQGELPSNQPLIDWLAVELVNQKWSMKALHRMIVTSATYRQASAVTPELAARDPQNVLLARGPRFRAEAEVVRDAVLKASGLLSGKMFGPSVYPPQPASVTNEGAYGKLAWNASTGEDRYRRSLYTFAKRTAPYALYGTFDAPTGEACVARRELSNTPLQALSLMNDLMFVEAFQALGKLAAEQKGDDAARATFVFRRALTRPPTADELELLTKFAAAQRQRVEKKELDPQKLSGSKDADAAERAVWTAVARAVLNLDEAVTKN
ncbi:MAG TPA: DUF1549 and DUF1553 domain-containing protein [Humisphaera sp.]